MTGMIRARAQDALERLPDAVQLVSLVIDDADLSSDQREKCQTLLRDAEKEATELYRFIKDGSKDYRSFLDPTQALIQTISGGLEDAAVGRRITIAAMAESIIVELPSQHLTNPTQFVRARIAMAKPIEEQSKKIETLLSQLDAEVASMVKKLSTDKNDAEARLAVMNVQRKVRDRSLSVWLEVRSKLTAEQRRAAFHQESATK